MDNSQIRVFISYAWESDEFRNTIWDLAGWLQANSNQRVKVISDHLYANVPPEEGFQIWMQREITKADIVLSVCSPNYVKYFEKDDFDSKGGYGVTFEGLIITQKYYECKGKNKKFFPICPDESGFNHVPLILRPYNNGHCFHSNNDRILKLILGENPVHKEEDVGNGIQPSELIALEKEITDVISDSDEIKVIDMDFDIQILIRTYLSLSSLDKIKVIKLIKGDLSYLPTTSEFERDKAFMESNKDQESLKLLWTTINQIKPFDNPKNPF